MKFFSVFVLYLYMRTAHSYYTRPTVSSNPVVSQGGYSRTNLQNSYQPIGQNYERPKLPVNAQNAYPNVQQSYQQSPIQQEYRIGPGQPIPYQISQTASGTRNNVQTNYQAYNGKLPAHVQHIVSHPYLKAMYKKSIPTKRYTIVHPNGTIEHTDEIQGVTARYPNYLMVKATDILAHVNQPNAYNKASSNVPPYQLNKPVRTNQNQAWSSSNSYQGSYNNQFSNNAYAGSTVPNVNPINQYYPNSKNQEAVKSTDVLNNVSVNPPDQAVINKPVLKEDKQKVINVSTNPPLNQNIQKMEIYNPPTFQESHAKVVAANPLPIYAPETLEKYEQPTKSYIENSNMTNYSTGTQETGATVAKADSNFTEKSKVGDNQILTGDKTTAQKSGDLSERETLEVILPEVKQQNTTQEIQTPNRIDVPQEEVITELPTIEEPITMQNTNLTPVINITYSTAELVADLAPKTVIDVTESKNTLSENVHTVDATQTSINSTNTIEDIQELTGASKVSSDTTILSVSNQTSTTFSNSPPLTWFHLSEDSVLEAIRSNASNVYFFFMPPKSKRVKEIRTTIFPNGTTVKEIIERNEDDEDEEPSR